MAYNSAHTGPEIDAAVGAVKGKEATWDGKQDKLTGSQGQFVGFTADNVVGALDAPVGLPTGGTTGQMLYQGESGAEWGDKPVMYVTITGDEESGYQADKTTAEVYKTYQDGYAVFAKVGKGSVFSVFPIASAYIISDFYYVIFSAITQTTATLITITDGSGTDVTTVFSQNFSDLYAKQEYVDAMKPKSVSITLPASGWSSNTQTVTVSGVLADETAQLIQPMPAIASQNAYISAGVICSGQAANQLSFTCSTTPTEDISLYVVLTEVQS